MKEPLTPTQLKTLLFIAAYIAAKGYAPTFREVADSRRRSSTAGAKRLMDILAAKGYLVKYHGKSRGFAIAD